MYSTLYSNVLYYWTVQAQTFLTDKKTPKGENLVTLSFLSFRPLTSLPAAWSCLAKYSPDLKTSTPGMYAVLYT